MSTPKFTRRDFQYLADWIRKHTPFAYAGSDDPLVQSLADSLSATNPNFDRDRFIRAATRTDGA